MLKWMLKKWDFVLVGVLVVVFTIFDIHYVMTTKHINFNEYVPFVYPIVLTQIMIIMAVIERHSRA